MAAHLSVAGAGLHVWAGSGLGRLQALDMRQHSMQGALKGATGSIRAMQLDEDSGLLAAAGLDRCAWLLTVLHEML